MISAKEAKEISAKSDNTNLIEDMDDIIRQAAEDGYISTTYMCYPDKSDALKEALIKNGYRVSAEDGRFYKSDDDPAPHEATKLTINWRMA